MIKGGRFADLLAAQGWPWSAPVEWHDCLDSTSDRLKSLARAGAPEGTVVVADMQTGGRGRHGRAWVSPLGNLYVSVLLRPSAASVPVLPLATGVAVSEGLDALGVSSRLKWPNDVMAMDRKLGGILAESSSTASSIDWVVVGIGVNVRAPLLPELRELAISLVDAGAPFAGVEDVACAVLPRLGVWYHRLAESGAAAVLDEWRLRSVSWWGETVEAWSAESRIVGRAAGVDAQGGLILELDDGSRTTLRSGEVRRCRPVS